jgi:uncharacterized membrane protein
MSISDDTSANDGSTVLPAHVEQTVQAIAKLHIEHHREATEGQKTIDRLTRFVGRPSFALALAIAFAAWMAGNLAMLLGHRTPLDPPPFFALQGVATVAAVFMTVFILISQRRSDRLSELRAQLTLQLAMASEHKTAKAISLLEELRRDLPNVINRVDDEADELARPADPEAVFGALKENQVDGLEAPALLADLEPADPEESGATTKG